MFVSQYIFACVCKHVQVCVFVCVYVCAGVFVCILCVQVCVPVSLLESSVGTKAQIMISNNILLRDIPG